MQHIIKHLFKADSLEEVPRERLEALVEEFPSFGMARYLLSRKLRAEDAAHFVEETQKTNLYFTNPFWLQWLLENDRSPAVTRSHQPAVEAQAIVPEFREFPQNAPEELLQPVEQEWSVREETPEVPVAMEEPAPEVQEVPAAPEEQPAEEELPPLTEEEQAGEKAPWPYKRTDLGSVTSETLSKFLSPSPDPSQALSEPVAPPAEPVAPAAAAEPIFQSYHTIDYFASQGIKLTLDENPSDRLGRQLKSFTDWLKVMKRIPQQGSETVPDVAAEHQIQAIAAHSIEGKEVLTEAMAEVLQKQGMRERAAEVYRKLSLLNPDKSSYFANKIEQLKEF